MRGDVFPSPSSSPSSPWSEPRTRWNDHPDRGLVVVALVPVQVGVHVHVEAARNAHGVRVQDHTDWEVPTPKQIEKGLSAQVMGQSEAISAVSAALYLHMKRLKDGRKVRAKQNILLHGPAACGKTILAETLHDFLKPYGIPVVKVDASQLVSAGYVGMRVGTMFAQVLAECGGSIELANRAVVVLDEIDKKNAKTTNDHDIAGAEAQCALLNCLEGCSVMIEAAPGRPSQIVDTKHMLFIGLGVFPGLMEATEERLEEEGAKNGRKPNPTDADFQKLGFSDEFVGRWRTKRELRELDAEAFARLLRGPASPLETFRQDFAAEDVELVVPSLTISFLAREALRGTVGVRHLEGVLYDVLQPAIRELPELRSSGIKRVVLKVRPGQGFVPVFERESGPNAQSSARRSPVKTGSTLNPPVHLSAARTSDDGPKEAMRLRREVEEMRKVVASLRKLVAPEVRQLVETRSAPDFDPLA